MSEPEYQVRGDCAPAFAGVREAFEENFRERGELGAAVCVTLGGETVVDLWGGWADAARTRPWERDTLVNVWSTTKGPVALCALPHCLKGVGGAPTSPTGASSISTPRWRRTGRSSRRPGRRGCWCGICSRTGRGWPGRARR